MAKILIVYDSRTGNTEKMALAVAEGAEKIEDVKASVKKVSQTSIDDLVSADGIARSIDRSARRLTTEQCPAN